MFCGESLPFLLKNYKKLPDFLIWVWNLLEFSKKLLSLEKILSLEPLEFSENRWKKKPDLVPCTPEIKNALSRAILDENGYDFFHHLTHLKGKVQGQKSAQKVHLFYQNVMFCHKNVAK